MSFCLLFIFGKGGAQILLDLPISNIYHRDAFNFNFEAGHYGNVLNLLPTFSTRSNSVEFENIAGGISSIPLNRANIRLIEVAGISLIGISNEVSLTPSWQVLASSVANLLASGPVIANLRLAIDGHTWIAGRYSAEVAFRAPGLLGIGNQISPGSKNIEINVPAFIVPQLQSEQIQLKVNNLNLFRSGEISTIESGVVSSTVPYIPGIQALSSQFSFSTSSAYNNSPNITVDHVTVEWTNSASAPISLSETKQPLVNTYIDVPTENKHDVNNKFSINSDALKANFVQAGNYSVPLIHFWDKEETAYPSGNLQEQKNSTLEIVVDEMGELIAQHQSVHLTFSSPIDYQSGVMEDMPQHLRISNTIPYDLYVWATSGSFDSGNETLPLDVLQIGPMPGEVGVNTITLSNSPQKLIDSADPVIDRYLNVRYQIPASQTSRLMGKNSGLYSTDIIYSFVAP